MRFKFKAGFALFGFLFIFAYGCLIAPALFVEKTYFIELFSYNYEKSIGHTCKLFLSFLSCSTDLSVSPSIETTIKCDSSHFFCSYPNCLAILSFAFSYKFKNNLVCIY